MWLFSSSSSKVRAFSVILVMAAVICPAGGLQAESEVYINILKTPGQKLTAALPPFFTKEISPKESDDLLAVLENDLRLSGFFQVTTEFLPGENLNGLEGIGKTEIFDNILSQGFQLLINVHLREEKGKLVMEGLVFDPASQRQIFGKRYRGSKQGGLKMVHLLAGDIIQELTGVKPMTSSRLAFLWNISGIKRVYVSDYDGRNMEPVSPEGELSLFPEWSPDNGLVYTSFESSMPQLIYHSPDTGFRKVLASYPGMNANSAYSPDGRHVLVTLSQPGNPEIFKLDSKGRIVKRMTFDRAVDTSPVYSPDGRRFAFVSDRGGGPQIYTMDEDGGKPVRVTFKGHYNVSPSWSPDGKYLAYSSIVGGRFQIMLLNMQDGEVVQLTDGSGSKEDPSWGPDGRHIVFTLTKGYKSDLYMLDIFSKELNRITKGRGSFTSTSWSGGN
jgi:TolB protein